MAKLTKLQALLDQKAKIESQLKEEMDKRLIQVGQIAKKHNLIQWPNESLSNAFKFISEQGESEFASAASHGERNARASSPG